MNRNRIIRLSISMLFVFALQANARRVMLPIIDTFTYIAPNDSIEEEEDWHDDLLPVDTGSVVHENFIRPMIEKQKNLPKSERMFYAMDYMLNDGRYLPYGDSFTKSWEDHLYIQGGFGAEQIMKSITNYGVNTFTKANLAIGKQFNRYHSVRLNADMGIAFKEKSNDLIGKFGADISYLYSFSSFMNGYNPARALDISGVITAGGNYTKGFGTKKFSYNGKAGLQFKFFTGPQGYVALEPYIGISSDQIDMSDRKNWRKHDVIYGASLNYIWYLRNNLSREARIRFIENRYRKSDFISGDSTLRAWHTRFFFETSNGVSFIKSPTLSMEKTLGFSTTVSVGYWISPVLAVRLSAITSDNPHMREYGFDKEYESKSPYKTTYHSLYSAARLDGLFNPMAFTRKFRWSNKWGAYLVGGVEFGWMNKYSHEELKCYSTSFNGGLHIFRSLAPGLNLFAEPSFTHRMYRIPFVNASGNEIYSDDFLDFKIGITVQPIYRYTGENRRDLAIYKLKHIVIGASAGMHHIWKNIERGNSAYIPYNANIFGEYHFNDIFAVRTSFDFINTKTSQYLNFTDYSIKTGELEAPVERNGLWNITKRYGILSLAGQVNLKNLFCGTTFRNRFTFEGFAGPALFLNINNTAKIDPSEIVREQHVLVNAPADIKKMSWGVMGGLKLIYRMSNSVDVFAMPIAYMWKDSKFQTGYTMSYNIMQSLNFGVQYKLK